MADNTSQTGNDTISTDDIAGVKVQRVKVQFGADGSATDVSPTNALPIAAVRSDGEGIVGTDGAQQQLHVNELGRLKVSTLPGEYSAITGSITAIQATIGTPVAGGTVIADVSRASNVNMFCTGTFAGVNVTFEGSIETTGENWFGVQGVRTNANTVETATGALSAAPAYAWELSVNALKRIRVRATARTSGTQNWTILPGAYATEPIPAVQTHPVTISGTWNVGLNARSDAGTTMHKLLSAATTNATSVKTSAANLYACQFSNTGASAAYIKFYNKASAPTVGTDVPVKVICVPAGQYADFDSAIPPRFTTGLAYAITGAYADNDTTAVALGQVIVNIDYV